MTRDYRWIDKDPAIDVIRQAYLNSPMPPDVVAAKAGITRQTFDRWLYGETKRPQHRTIAAVCRALGIEIRYVHDANRNRDIDVHPRIGTKFTKLQEQKRRRERRKALAPVTVRPQLRVVGS